MMLYHVNDATFETWLKESLTAADLAEAIAVMRAATQTGVS